MKLLLYIYTFHCTTNKMGEITISLFLKYILNVKIININYLLSRNNKFWELTNFII